MSMQIIHGDCKEITAGMESESVNLIMTSPPYSDQRKSTYGGIKADKYIDWFIDAQQHWQRILADDGSVIINIKENCVNGQRSLYVYKLMIELVEQCNWRFVDDFIWLKTNPYPGSWPNRLKDAWEHCFHLCKSKNIKFRPDAVTTDPKQDYTMDPDKWDFRTKHKSGSPMTMNKYKISLVEKVRPNNTIETSIGGGRYGSDFHPATFPPELPERFIQLFTDRGDTVLDPFAGSGTTIKVSDELGRNGIGIEIMPEYYISALDNLLLPYPDDLSDECREIVKKRTENHNKNLFE